MVACPHHAGCDQERPDDRFQSCCEGIVPKLSNRASHFVKEHLEFYSGFSKLGRRILVCFSDFVVHLRQKRCTTPRYFYSAFLHDCERAWRIPVLKCEEARLMCSRKGRIEGNLAHPGACSPAIFTTNSNAYACMGLVVRVFYLGNVCRLPHRDVLRDSRSLTRCYWRSVPPAVGPLIKTCELMAEPQV